MSKDANFRFNIAESVKHVANHDVRFFIVERALIQSAQATVKKYIARQILGDDHPDGPGISAGMVELQEQELTRAKK